MEEGLQDAAIETTDSGGTGVVAAQALEGLKVHFISLVPNPANKRHFLVMKAAELGAGFEVVEKHVQIVRKDAFRKMVYGVVLAPNEVDDELDTITIEEIEKAAYAFMRGGRTQQIDTDHSTEAGAGFVAESWIVRVGDPLFAEETPGTWVVGVKVTDEAAWERIETEDLLGFSVGGYARRVPVEVEVETVAKQQIADEGGEGPMFEATAERDVADVRVEKAMDTDDEASESAADVFVRKVKEKLGLVDVSKRIRVEIQEKKSDMAGGVADSDDMEEEADKGVRVEIQERKSDMSAGATHRFREHLVSNELWQATGALSDAIREVLQDDDVADKAAAITGEVGAFEAWLKEALGHVRKAMAAPAVSKEEVPIMDSGVDVEEAVLKAVAPLTEQIEQLQAELEALGGQHAGRETMLGGADRESVKKSGKGYRGLRIKL